MEQRLTTQQVEQIVGEVGRLANRQETELDRSQVLEILQELNLPPALLDDAMIQVQRKEALARQRKRNQGIAIASIASLVILVAGTGLFFQNKAATIAKINVGQDRITLAQDGGQNLNTVNKGSEIAYRATLNDAPIGQRLNLTCNWIDPTGKIAHTNHYETKNITTSVWNTACRYQIPSGANSGTWKVQIITGDRLLKQSPFMVN